MQALTVNAVCKCIPSWKLNMKLTMLEIYSCIINQIRTLTTELVLSYHANQWIMFFYLMKFSLKGSDLPPVRFRSTEVVLLCLESYHPRTRVWSLVFPSFTDRQVNFFACFHSNIADEPKLFWKYFFFQDYENIFTKLFWLCSIANCNSCIIIIIIKL